MHPMTLPSKAEIPAKASNFLRQVIERDLEAGTYSSRRFAGTPGDATHHAAGPVRAFHPSPTAICTSVMPRACA
jgi:glutaminyl-tRNA synthetase